MSQTSELNILGHASKTLDPNSPVEMLKKKELFEKVRTHTLRASQSSFSTAITVLSVIPQSDVSLFQVRGIIDSLPETRIKYYNAGCVFSLSHDEEVPLFTIQMQK